MTLVRKVCRLYKHDPNIGSLKDYLGNLEDANHGCYLLDLLE